jgi:hypothetical protein
MAKVRGSALVTRVAFVKERYGDEGWRRFETLLSPVTRRIVGATIDPRAWYPFEAFVDVNVRADALFGRGDYKLCFEMGGYGADRNMTTLYRVFFRLGSVSFVMGKAASLWSEHYDGGRLVTDGEDRKRFTLRIEDFPAPHCAHCMSVAGWAKRTVELTGATVLDTQRTACRNWRDAACTFVIATT